MRLVVAQCTVTYTGRLSAVLPSGVRLVMIKADGCVAIHADGGAYKPLNWMTAPNFLEEAEGHWVVTNSKGETLTIEFHEVFSDTAHDMEVGPGLVKDGVEHALRDLLAGAPHAIGDGLMLVRREYPTPIGPVDLMLRDRDGRMVAVEVKRRGEIDGVEQLARYVECLDQDARLRPVRGVFAAQKIAPQARVLAEQRGLGWVEVDYDALKGGRVDNTLF
ncbi:MAG TPA: endonuclease NucS [Acidimicrobiales bacterium]|nr:endonuclease NucS [Acidimicrobiales bacterium]